jgi:hypothetical protein
MSARIMFSVVFAVTRDAGRSGPFEVTASGGITSRDRDGFRRLEEAGATRVVVGPPPEENGRLTVKGVSDWAKRFADEVIAAY